MCPLRIILIFLSATLAGFFVLKGFKSRPQINDPDDDVTAEDSPLSHVLPPNSLNRPFQVLSALVSGFQILVDMATGRYLWSRLVS